jgi:plasmid stability protein
VRNITVSVDDETYRLARVRAAESDTSVSALVRDFLQELVHGETREERFERLKRKQDEVLAEIRARGGGLRAADNLTRDELYDRKARRAEAKLSRDESS